MRSLERKVGKSQLSFVEKSMKELGSQLSPYTKGNNSTVSCV